MSHPCGPERGPGEWEETTVEGDLPDREWVKPDGRESAYQRNYIISERDLK